ncbi:MAG TPA: glutamyl-tRNA reductase [Syntrophomonadaceae bacterium]|nr:glutamyl-tRNA reductase [Syntrophomonadaceae bacterium]
MEIREKFAFSEGDIRKAYQELKSTGVIEGVVFLNTCNRTEIYATVRDVTEGQTILEDFLTRYSGLKNINPYIYQPNCFDAISHIFKVTAGMDSMILGETQILGQVKDAYQRAIDLKTSDGVLNTLFQRAIYVGKRVRTETEIDRHPVSVSYAAVELARDILGPLTGKTVLVVGAGEMSELTARYLMLNGVNSFIVSNRSFDKAVSMADALGGKAVRFDELAVQLEHADIVISCTAASHYVLHERNCREVLEARGGSRIIMIDIAVPRDVDPVLGDIEGVYIYDIDDLQNVVDSSLLERQRAARAAESIVAQELAKFNEWMCSLYVVPVITALKDQVAAIQQNELKKAFNRLGTMSEHDQIVIASMANSIANQILHNPIVNLKEAATTNQGHLYAEVVNKLFDLQIDKREDRQCNL